MRIMRFFLRRLCVVNKSVLPHKAKISKNTRNKIFAHIKKTYFLWLGTLIAPAAFAQASESPVGQGLGYILNNLIYGADGTVLATIAVAGVGIACWKHTIEWKYFFYTVGGIAIVFGAPAIVQGIKSLVTI